MMWNTVRANEPISISGSRITAAQFSQLVSDHLDVVWRLAAYLNGETGQAETLVESCARLAFARRSTLVSSIGFKPWFLGLLVESWQQTSPRNLRLVSNAPSASLGDAYEMAQVAGLLDLPDPSGAIMSQLTPDNICGALGLMPSEDRVVVALSLADDLSYREIGLVLALSAETVRTRLHRGRALLKIAVIQRLQEH